MPLGARPIFDEGGDAMPKVKERKPDDKIKNQGKRKGGGPVQDQARRVMTAKMRKELAQQKRSASGSTGETARDDSPTTEAVEQVEQTTGAAVQEVGRRTKQGVSRTVTKAKQEHRKIKERQDQQKEGELSPEPPAPETPEAPALEPDRPAPREQAERTPPRSKPQPTGKTGTGPAAPREKPVPSVRSRIPGTRPASNLEGPATPKVRPAETPTDPPVPRTRTEKVRPIAAPAGPWTADKPPALPTPGERMREWAVDKRRKQAQEHRQTPASPEYGGPPPVSHYGKSPAVPGSSVFPPKTPSFENQSIYPSIKERPRSSVILKEKVQGWTITPRTRQSVEQAAGNAAVPPKASTPAGKKTTAKRLTERMRQKAKTEAQRTMAQGTKKTARAAADLSRKAATATAKAVKSLIGALSALVGGATLAAALCVIFLIAAVIASPFGLLFSNEPSPGAVPLNAAVTQINVELTDKLALLQAGDYDSVDVQGSGPDWREVAAVFAVKTSLGADGLDVAALTPDRVNRLKTVFWDMCEITTSMETIDHPANGNAEAWTEKILHITITARTADEMRTVYFFTPEQNRALTELLAELNGIGTLLGDLGITQEDAAELLRRLPENLSSERWAVVETACKLVGKVNYFWGGKSLVLGWDSRWGTIQKVWAAGSPSTGTYRPYGMDCSGFVDWVFYNMSGGSYVIGHGGGARMQHSYCTPISWSQAQPGDLVFYPEDTHVGIVGGWDESGNIQIIHCASGQNNVVITGKAGFTSIGRPDYYG